MPGSAHALHHPSCDAQDVASVTIAHQTASQDTSREWLEALLDACAMSRQVWTAANAQGEPLAFIGAAPWTDDHDRGRLWFVVLATYDVNDGDLKAVMRLTLMEMLQVFSQLRTMSARKRPGRST